MKNHPVHLSQVYRGNVIPALRHIGLLEADEDLSELMNEIMTEMVLVETAEARRELASAKAEAEELRRRLAERGG